MKTFKLSDIAVSAPQLAALIQRGEEVAVVENGTEFAKIVPTRHAAKRQRPAGLARGKFTVPVDFNENLPDEIVRDFEGR